MENKNIRAGEKNAMEVFKTGVQQTNVSTGKAG